MTRTKQLMRENNTFERALNPEFNQVLTDMVVYLRSAPVSEYNQELVRRDIGQMFLDAQRRGDSPADVIGEDYRQFCDQVLAEVPRLTVRERMVDGLSASLLCVGVWGVIWFVSRGVRGWFFQDGAVTGGWPDIPVTTGDALVTALILAAAGYLFHAFSRAAFSNSYIGLFFKIFTILAAMLVVGRVFDGLLGYLHFGIVLAGIVLCFVLSKVLEYLADR